MTSAMVMASASRASRYPPSAPRWLATTPARRRSARIAPRNRGGRPCSPGQVLGGLGRAGGGQREQGPDAVVDLGRDVHGESLPCRTPGGTSGGADNRAKISMARSISTSPATTRPTRLLVGDPLALLIGMVLDQQIPMEKAFSSPAELARRHGPTARRRGHRRHGPRRAGRALQGASRAAPLPRLHGRPGAGGLPRRGRGLWRPRPRTSGRRPPAAPSSSSALKTSPGSASRRRGSSPRCWASSSACGPTAGKRPAPPSATTGPSSPSPTSPTPRPWPKSGRPRRP